MYPATPERGSKYFHVLGILFVATLMLSNMVAGRLFQVGPFPFIGQLEIGSIPIGSILAGPFFFSSAILIFPFSYIFGDILTEVYGYPATRKVIWLGFLALLFMSVVSKVIGFLPEAPFGVSQASFDSVLGVVPRVALASIVGYWFGENANSIVVSYLKVRMNGEKPWMRFVGSTIVGQAIDSALFFPLAFYGTPFMSNGALLVLMVSSYLLKVVYEILVIPVTCYVVDMLKRKERIDTMDKGVSRNPLKFA